MSVLSDYQSALARAIKDRNSALSEFPTPALKIYQASIRQTLCQTLTRIYLPLSLWLEAVWLGLMDDFIDAHLPRSPVLDEYGDSLPAFIRQHSILAQFPDSADMAQFCYQQFRIFLGEAQTTEKAPLHADDLNCPQNLICRLPSNYALQQAGIDLFQLYRHLLDASMDRAMLETILQKRGDYYFFTYKVAAEVKVMRLTPSQYQLLCAVESEQNYLALCQGLLAEDASFQFTEALLPLVQQHCIHLTQGDER